MYKTLRSDILLQLNNADLIQLNDDVARPSYIRAVHGQLDTDDVLLEMTVNGEEVDFTVRELEEAQDLGEGSYLVKHRGVVRFLREAQLH
ncbi:hypothetical protein ABWL39_06860 [Chitinivorax sp. PXF-14]|uniref:hypothetical protein n=1 Tax=Chitinivorax sp. PXF-14 TaxID=3230488 RepID=UPI003465F81A